MSDANSSSTDLEITEETISTGLKILMEKTGYFAVFSTISALKTAHLSRIARIIGKSKSAVLSSIESMISEDHPVIEVDVDTTINTKGVKKYYKFTSLGIKIESLIPKYFSDSIVITEEQMDQARSFTQDDYQNLVKNEMKTNLSTYKADNLFNFFTLNSELNVHFRKTAAHGYLELAEAFTKGDEVEENKIPYGVLYTSLKRISVSNFQQSLKIRHLLSKFIENIRQLEEEINEENQQKLSDNEISQSDIHDQILSVDLTPIIDFEN